MARVIFTGCEWGAAEFAASGGTFSFSTTTVRPGGSVRSLRINPTAGATGFVRLQTFSATGAPATAYSVATGYHTVFFRYATRPSSDSEAILKSWTGTNAKLTVDLDLNGRIVVFDSSATPVATGSTVLSANIWYQIDVKVGTGTPGPWEVRINGTVELSQSNNILNTNEDRCTLGTTTGAFSGIDYFFDDFALDDAAYPGEQVTVAKHPNANGSTMQWTAGTAPSNWTTVDEAVPAAADYVMTTGAGNETALFDLEDAATAPAVSGTIHSTLGLVQAREDTAGATTFKLRLRSNVTNSDNSTLDIGALTVTNGRYVDLDPDTGAAWTTGGIDGAEVGAVEASTVAVRMSTATLMVNFTAGAGVTRGVPVIGELDGIFDRSVAVVR